VHASSSEISVFIGKMERGDHMKIGNKCSPNNFYLDVGPDPGALVC